MKKTYSEKLQDPRWQKKRLEILNRDEFKCELCQDTEETLHVHHIFYMKGVEPWEYPDEMYNTLCKVCHHSIEILSKIDRSKYWIGAIKKKNEKTGHSLLFLRTYNEQEPGCRIEVFNHNGKESEFLVSLTDELIDELKVFIKP